jgi:hypothetical protein
MTIDGLDDDDGMNDSAAAAARMLRTDVPVRPEWREALLARVEADSRRSAEPRVWRLRPVVAIAAGVVLILLGAAGARLLPDGPGARLSGAVVAPAAVRFVFVAPSAGNVSVVGDFNQWNPSAIPLRRLSDGTWIADVPLAPGRYAYAFVVDGRLEPDPSAPRAADGDFGVANSIIMIRGS